MKHPDLLHALHDCLAVIRRAERIATDANHPYIAQLMRRIEWSVHAAIETMENAVQTEEAVP
jgi:hypothetical protein